MAPVTLGKQHLYKRPGFDSLVTWFVLIVVAVASLTIVSSTLYVVFHNYVRLPYYDEWEMIGHWNDKWRNVDLGWRHLFDQHNEHRIALPRLVFFTDLGWFHGTGTFTLTSVIFTQFFHTLVLTRLVSGLFKWRSICSLVAASLIFILMFSALQIENLIWAFQLQFVGVFLFATLAFFFLLQPISEKRAIFSVLKSPFVIGILFCLAATFTMSNGLLVWPVGIMIGVQQRWSPRRLLLFLGFTCVTWFVYFFDFQFNPGHSNPWDELVHFWVLLQYAAIYLGHPISPFWQDYAMGIGFIGIILTTFLVVRLTLDRPQQIFNSHSVRTLLAVSIFILLTAIVTASGRIEFGLQQAASSRYATPALIYWIATCSILLSINAPSKLGRTSLRYLGAALGFSVVASVATFQFTMIPEITQRLTQTRAVAASALLAGIYDKSALQHIHPRPWQIESTIDVLRENKLSLFSMGFAKLVGQPLEQLVSIESNSYCAGHIDEVTTLSSTQAQLRVRGWAIDRRTGKRADTVVLVTEGAITGIAFPGLGRPDVEAIFPGIKDSGWLGYAKIRPSADLQAYALLNQGQSACLLNGSYRQ